jgi:hypothetical protein
MENEHILYVLIALVTINLLITLSSKYEGFKMQSKFGNRGKTEKK